MVAPLPISRIIRFHSRLNPRLWYRHELRIEVRLKLLQAAIAFYRFLDLPALRIKDIIITGSNAAYNYTALSDIDVHLVVDYKRTTCPTLASNFFFTKKALWGKTYDIVVREHPVELYVEDTAEPVKANGVYSVLHNHWIKTPTDTPPTRDDSAVEQKAQAYVDEIDNLLNGEPNIAAIDQLLGRLYTLRQNGLLAGGEFSVENLAYKSLRTLGYIEKLHDARVKRRDHELSMR